MALFPIAISACLLLTLLTTGLADTLPSHKEALEAFKSAAVTPEFASSSLLSWVGDPCTRRWEGVRCEGRNVVMISMSGKKLGGTLSPFLGNITSLTMINLYNTQLTGPIPLELGSIFSLSIANLGTNKLSGDLPPQLGNLLNLTYLDLSTNNLTGQIPPAFGNLAKLSSLYLDKNSLSGSIPPELGNLAGLRFLTLGSNKLSGPIPPSLGTLKSLQSLFLESNSLNGTIPSELGDLANLGDFFCSYNQLSGSIPPSLGQLSRLRKLDFGSNMLTGPIPPELSGLTSIEELTLGTNRLTGSIPSELGTLPQLKILGLRENLLNGSIPSELGNLTNLQQLRLSGNGFMGAIPATLFSLNLSTMDLGKNYLVGPVPDTLDNGKIRLQGNCIGVNRLSPVPTQRDFATCARVYPGLNCTCRADVFDISLPCNCSSAIPPSSSQGPAAAILPPPSTVPSPSQGPAAAYMGGTDSPPSPLDLDGSSFSQSSAPNTLSYIVPSIVVPSLVAIVVVFLWRRGYFTKKKSTDPPLRVWTFADLEDATNGFSGDNLIGNGGFGAVYIGNLTGFPVAIKRLEARAGERAEEDFVKEVRTIGAIHNPNLVALRGYCAEGKERLLVYDYLSNGSLDDVVFKNDGQRELLTWPRCVKILQSAARGIAYLHDYQKIIHRAIKPANFLLDKDFEAYVSDFGLEKSTIVADTQAVTNTMGTMGYLAPEYAHMGKLTEKSDVYSFGVLILVMVSHQLPFDRSEMGRRSVLVDKVMAAAREGRLLSIVAGHFAGSYEEEEARRVINVGILCVQAVWESRPTMEDVVQMLTGKKPIRDADLKQAVAPPQDLIPKSSRFGWSKKKTVGSA